MKQTTSAPKKLFNSLLEGTSEVGRLEEDLISSRLREVETLAELKEWKMKIMETENQVKFLTGCKLLIYLCESRPKLPATN